MSGVSFDYSKAQQVEAFAQFLSLLSDPEGLAKLFADIKEARASAEAAIAAKTKVDDVDSYVKRAEADIDKKYTEIEAQIANSREMAESLDKSQKAFAALVAEKERELRVKADEFAEREKAFATKEQELSELVAATQVAKERAEAAETAANTLVQSLRDKEAALKKVLGE